jgi:hypothetical protein
MKTYKIAYNFLTNNLLYILKTSTTTKTTTIPPTPIPTSTSTKKNTNVNGNEIIYDQNTDWQVYNFQKMKCNVTLFGQKNLKHL